MKKKGQMIVGIGLGVVLLGAVGIYSWQSGLLDSEQETTEAETTGVKPPMPITQEEMLKIKEETLKNSIHALNEEIGIDGLIWNVYSAKIVDGYKQLDDYYKKRSVFKDPEKEQLHMAMPYFQEEEKFVALEFSVLNNSTETKTIYPGRVKFYNRLDETTFEDTLLEEADGRCLNSNSIEIVDFATEGIEIPVGEQLTFEYVIPYQSYYYPIYDLYVSLNGASDDINLGGVDSETKVCLEIAPKLRQIYYVNAADSSEEARDIPAMKSRQWTNLEMKEYQLRAFPEPGPAETEADVAVEEIVEQGYEFVDDITTKITASKVISWDEMPAEYQERGALDGMAQRYETQYGYSKENLKILLLDISYTAAGEISESMDPYRHYCDFYMNSFLYTRESDGKRWVFGTMDDWLVTSNTTNESRTGHINIEKIRLGHSVELQAAYILPPDIYENQEALYFDGGKPSVPNDDIPIAAIPLK